MTDYLAKRMTTELMEELELTVEREDPTLIDALDLIPQPTVRLDNHFESTNQPKGIVSRHLLFSNNTRLSLYHNFLDPGYL